LARDLEPRSGSAEVAAAIEWASAGLEVVECHFRDWKMTVGEAVADAGVHAALAIGSRVKMTSTKATLLAEIEGELMCDGEVVERGPATKALGGPVQALVWLLRDLPIGLRAGEFITTGSMTTAVAVSPGHRWINSLDGPVAMPGVELDLT
jgi:2-keto-4-pentenoate hydratase